MRLPGLSIDMPHNILLFHAKNSIFGIHRLREHRSRIGYLNFSEQKQMQNGPWGLNDTIPSGGAPIDVGFGFELETARGSHNHDVLSNSNKLLRPIYVNRLMQGLNSRVRRLSPSRHLGWRSRRTRLLILRRISPLCLQSQIHQHRVDRRPCGVALNPSWIIARGLSIVNPSQKISCSLRFKGWHEEG